MLKWLSATLFSDMFMAGLVVAIISLMILPLPTAAIDTLLAFNISVSILLLMTTLFIPNAIAMSTFPTLLLFTTLLRLSLNIASTKSILLNADAGHLIETFGELVVGGNLVVGIVVFIILTVVQFIVISKGSERVAEVGARFTLDAMPGKQMSIDADLRANIITGEEAKRKRAMLTMESQMHGGMDGAMKFVKGDTIAGLIITLVNLCAGIVVGVMYHEMTASEAANRFAVLSIGDAMVSQIASLFISVAAGVLITRVADEHEKKPRSLGQEIGLQVTGSARAMYLAAGLVASFALVPGFPAIQFLTLALILGLGGRALDRQRRKQEQVVLSKPIAAMQRDGGKGDPPSIRQGSPQFARPLAIRMARSLAVELRADRLDEAIVSERQSLQERLGLPFPGVSMWVSDKLNERTFDVLLNDVPAATVQIPEKSWMLKHADSPLAQRAQPGGAVFGQSASLWVNPEGLSETQRQDLLDIETVMARQLMTCLGQQAHLFMGVQEVQWVLERVAPEYPGLVAEVQKILPLQRIGEVLRRLLEEQVPIRNLRSILESLITWGPKEKDLLMLTEYVRGDLGRFLAFEASCGRTWIDAVTMHPEVEQQIRQSVKPTPAGNFLAMAPDAVRYITDQIEDMTQNTARDGIAVVTSMDVRRYVRKMIEPRLAWLKVYSFQELGSFVELRPIGRVSG